MFSAQGSQVSSDAIYVDDVFSTYLYTGNGSTQTITNGIDLAGKGGMTWIKGRSGATNHALYDTARGATFDLVSNTTAAQTTQSTGLTAFTSSGFSMGALAKLNTSAATYSSWTFRKQPKFFDVQSVTKTAGVAATVDLSSLGTVGCVIVKRTDSTSNWFVWHRSQTAGKLTYLNLSNSETSDTTISVSGTTLTIAAGAAAGSYIVYAYAHNAAGFGAAGTDNVISCGSFTHTYGTDTVVNLGYEPQWLLVKAATGTVTSGSWNWSMIDTMRLFTVDTSSNNNLVLANDPGAEINNSGIQLTNQGFVATGVQNSSSTYIYIAIRRPHKPPTSGTQVFEPLGSQPLASGVFAHTIFTDFSFYKYRAGAQSWAAQDRLRGSTDLSFNSTAAEPGLIGGNTWDMMNGYKNTNPGAGAYASWAFKRAPGFFDQVCWAGDGASSKTISHGLQAAPELIIAKKRNAVGDWGVFCASQADGALLNTTDPFNLSNRFLSVGASSFVVQRSGTPSLNDSGATYTGYLFASLQGISKIGSYTGNGTSQTINCGFTAGARFVLIKRANGTGDWYVWDTARGIVAANDPHLSLNSTAAEVTTDDSVDADPSGFIVNQVTATSINVSGATYIFLAIA